MCRNMPTVSCPCVFEWLMLYAVQPYDFDEGRLEAQPDAEQEVYCNPTLARQPRIEGNQIMLYYQVLRKMVELASYYRI